MKEIGTKTLETKRLILRKYKIQDAEGMYKNWGSDPNCNIYLPWEIHENIECTKSIISAWINEYSDDKFNWIIELKENHEVIGGINVVKLNKITSICEIGYCIGSKFWNKGYTTEALNKVIEFLFEECEMYLIEAKHHASNVASGKVMEKSGMIKECELRNRALNRRNNKIENLVVYSIKKEEFNKYKNSH
ncbi:MAG: GNAT family N-acetyltransferase [Bacilli bacterium]|nr:GNAT family N-acetyltransferase [Bacilli bacterium]